MFDLPQVMLNLVSSTKTLYVSCLTCCWTTQRYSDKYVKTGVSKNIAHQIKLKFGAYGGYFDRVIW